MYVLMGPLMGKSSSAELSRVVVISSPIIIHVITIDEPVVITGRVWHKKARHKKHFKSDALSETHASRI
jgi:hypothetical protein